MGIKGLMKFLADMAPNAIKEGEIKNYFGRIIAFDAQMAIYQFLISIRGTGLDLTDDTGLITSHLQGMFFRTIKMVTLGIKPVFVFDGKPPEMKSEEIARRKEKKKVAEAKLKEAEETGDELKRIMWSKRTVRVTREQQEECKKLLRLMGCPVIESPSEAESQCSELVKGNLVYATATEDMDALTFGSPILLRNLSISESKAKKMKKPVKEINLQRVLQELRFTMDQFIDFCILCGCDYLSGIRNIGPKKAFKYISECKSIERMVRNILKKKPKGVEIPQNFLENVAVARKLFKNPDVIPSKNLTNVLKWDPPREKDIIQFLVNEKKFDMKRVVNGIERMKKAKRGGVQQRIDSFFKFKPKDQKSGKLSGKKRKRDKNSKDKKKNVKKRKRK